MYVPNKDGAPTMAQLNMHVTEEAKRADPLWQWRIYDTVDLMMWVVRHGSGNVVYVNKAWRDNTGTQMADWLNAVHPDDYHPVLSTRNACFESGEPFKLKYRVRFRDGGYRWHNVHAKLNKEENVWTAYCFETAEYMAPRSHFNSFLANVSHDLRTPLTGILALADDLMQDSRLTKDEAEDVETIYKCGLQQLDLVENLIYSCKVEAGKRQQHLEPFSLTDVVDHVVRLGLKLRTSSVVSLHCVYGSNIPAYVVGDKRGFVQVLTNLVSNAIKFTEKGSITVNLEAAINAELEELEMTCTVEDTGIGIKENALEKIFFPFVQGDETTNVRYGGSGLGLSICKSIVQFMGGLISVNSKFGEGSTFQIKLPFRLYTGPGMERSNTSTSLNGLLGGSSGGSASGSTLPQMAQSASVLPSPAFPASMVTSSPSLTGQPHIIDCFKSRNSVKKKRSYSREIFNTQVGHKDGTLSASGASPSLPSQAGTPSPGTSRQASPSPAPSMASFGPATNGFESSEMALNPQIRAALEQQQQHLKKHAEAGAEEGQRDGPVEHLEAQLAQTHIGGNGSSSSSSNNNIRQQRRTSSNGMGTDSLRRGSALRVLGAFAKESAANKLPFASADAAEDESDLDEVKRVALVVDDNELNVRVLCRFLDKSGFDYIVARDGQQAVDAYRAERAAATPDQRHIDIILMDIDMPIMNGYEATRLIRAMDAAGKMVPILALTASVDLDKECKIGFEAGMDGMVSKPYKFGILREKMDMLMQAKK